MSTQARSTYTRSLHPPTPYMQAVSAYLKSGDVKSAVDSCVRDHHWEVAVQLAETHNYPDIQKVRTPRHSPLNLHPDPIPSPGPSPNPHPNLHPDPQPSPNPPPPPHQVLTQYASHLLATGQQLHAVELYRKAKQHAEAAKLLSKLAKASPTPNPSPQTQTPTPNS